MSNHISIIYNGKDAFYPQPTPLVGMSYDSIYYSEKWAERETMTLNGQITGCTMSGIVQGQLALLNNFNQSFQPLQIWETNNGISGLVYEKDFTEILGINFPTNRWFGIMPYSITLACYPSGLFSGSFGILNPVDTWNFNERENAILEITHTISCKGINTSIGNNNALDNAQTWARARSGVNPNIYPIMISGVSTQNYTLLTQAENINRFDGSYSITEVYINDLARTGYGTVRYTTNVESGNNLLTVSLNGTVQGGQRDINSTRLALSGLDMLSIATKSYNNTFGEVDLNPIPLTQTFVEDPFNTKIDFSYVFDNSNYPQTYYDHSVDMQTAVNGVINASIRGTIHSRGGNLTERLNRCIAYAGTLNLYNMVLPYYNSFDVSSIAQLHPIPLVSGMTVNYNEGTVELNASFNNQEKENFILDRFNFTLDFQPRVEKVDAQPKLDGYGNYSVVDLGYANRARFTVHGNAVVNTAYSSDQGILSVKQTCFHMLQQYGRLLNLSLDNEEISTDRSDNRMINFSITWSFDSPYIIGPSTVSFINV